MESARAEIIQSRAAKGYKNDWGGRGRGRLRKKTNGLFFLTRRTEKERFDVISWFCQNKKKRGELVDHRRGTISAIINGN